MVDIIKIYLSAHLHKGRAHIHFHLVPVLRVAPENMLHVVFHSLACDVHPQGLCFFAGLFERGSSPRVSLRGISRFFSLRNRFLLTPACDRL